MTPKRIAEIQKALEDPDFLANRPVIEELLTAYVRELDRYNDSTALLTEMSKVRDELKKELADADDQLAQQTKELDADRMHKELAEGEDCPVCTHLTSQQIDEIYARQEEEIRILTEKNANLERALEFLTDGLPKK